MKKLIYLVVVLTTTSIFAQNNLKNKIAIQGYDPVAYFESNKAVEGNKTITSEFNNAIYFFSSDDNKAQFLKDPEQYLPQFGGYCAYGMSEGYKAPIQPEVFTIVDQKLYLNYNLEVKEMWLKDRENRITKASKTWEKVKKEK